MNRSETLHTEQLAVNYVRILEVRCKFLNVPLKRFVDRPPGTSSRLTRVSKATSHWVAANGLRVELPAEIDVAHIDEPTNSLEWLVVAKIDLVDESPSLVSVEVKGFPQLDTHHLQSFFRWPTPLDIIIHTVPALMCKGIDPYNYDYATEGFPNSVFLDPPTNERLSDDFLHVIARLYVTIGRRYASALAGEYGVSQRTVVSWIEKARKRGILPPTKAGKPTF